MDFRYDDDIELVRHLRNLSYADLARGTGLSEKTLRRWANREGKPGWASLEAFYGYAFELGVELNRIKAQLHKESLEAEAKTVLFHGSRAGIEGPLSVDKCDPRSDFGRGFYCGESLEQSALFVSNFPKSSVYVASFDPMSLRCERYAVGQDWMLTIAAFRGKLKEYRDHPRVVQLMDRVHRADYVIEPIADNRMYEIISEFLDGITTDVVCEHCLSATQLGSQYVFLTPRALRRVELIERCFLSQGERQRYSAQRKQELRGAEDKVKAAKRLHRGEGRFIDELLS